MQTPPPNQATLERVALPCFPMKTKRKKKYPVKMLPEKAIIITSTSHKTGEIIRLIRMNSPAVICKF